MGASTAFFGTIRLFKEMTSVIREVDDGLVALKKVMDEDTNFDNVMQTAIDSSEKFARTLGEALDAMEEFAKQGYKELDLTFLTEAGLVAANVAELTAQQASEYLTSTIIQWKKETNEAMGIIDSWNNISNNFATTTEKLAQGHSRSASTARTMGLSFHELNAVIGSVTASTKQSGNEIGNFIKNVLPRLTSKPAQDALDMINVSMFDNAGNMRHVIDIYQDVADKLKTMDKYNQSIVLEGLAGKFHISRMSAFLSDLGSVDSIYREMLDASVDSQGSALRENETYMESITARAKLARVEFEKMSLAMGDSFLTETMIQVYKGMSVLFETTGKFTSAVGGIPLILGTAGMAFVLFSKRIKESDTLLKILDLTMKTVGRSTDTLSKTMKGFLVSTGVGIGIVTLSFALEGLLYHIGKAREAQEELERNQRETLDTYKQGKDNIDDLSKSYEKYEKVINSGDYSLEDLSEFNRIRNEIAEIMPNMIIGEDSYGNKIIKSSEEIRKQNELLERQLEVQERLDQLKRKEQVEKDYSTAQDLVKDNQDKIKQLERESGHSFESAKRRLEELQNKQLELAEQGKKLGSWDARNLEIVKNVVDKYMLLDATLMNSYVALQNTASEYIRLNLEMDGSVSKTTKSIIDNFTTLVATSGASEKSITDVFDSFKDSIDSGDFNKLFKDLESSIETYNKKIEEGLRGNQLDSFAKDVESASKNINNAFLNMAKSNGITEKEFETIAIGLEIFIKNVLSAGLDWERLSKSTGKTVEELRLELGLLGEEFDNTSENIDGANDSLSELAKTLEDATSYIKSLTDILFDLNEGQGVTSNIITKLAKDYPELLEYINDESTLRQKIIEKIQEQESIYKKSLIKQMMESDVFIKSVYKSNADFYKWLNDTYDVDLNNFKTLSKAKEAVESKLIGNLSEKWGKYFRASADGTSVLIEDTEAFFKLSPEDRKKLVQDIHDANKQLEETAKRFDDIAKVEFEGTANAIAGLTREQDKNTKSNKANSDSLKETIYYTDEYKNAVSLLNLELEKLNKIKSKYPSHSKQYRDSLEQEIKLQQQLLNLNKQHQQSLNKQIKTGNFQQTGMVSSSGSGSSVRLANTGWSNKITSNYGMRKHPVYGDQRMHHGIDIAFAQGSNLPVNISGTVKSAGFTSGGYGGLIEIVDAQGRTHRYAHLNQINVKAGQQVNVGDIIAKTGGAKGTKGAGTSTGAHLHYEVRINGKSIDPKDFVNQAKGLTVATNNIGQTQAELAQSSDQARSEIISLQQDALRIQEIIDGLNFDYVKSLLDEQRYNAEVTSREIEFSEAKLKNRDKFSVHHETELSNQVKLQEKKRQFHYNERILINQQLKSDKLSAVAKEELTQRYHELTMAIAETNWAINELEWRRTINAIDRQKRSVEEYDYQIEHLKITMERLNQVTWEFRDALFKQINMHQRRKKEIFEEREQIKELYKNEELSLEQKRELQQMLKDLSIEYQGLVDVIDDYNKKLRDTILLNNEHQKESIDFLLDMNRARMDLINKDRPDYNEKIVGYVKEEIELLKEKLSWEVKNEKDISNIINGQTLTATELLERNKQLNESKLNQLRIQKLILDAENELVTVANNKLGAIKNTENKIIEMIRKRVEEEKKGIQDVHAEFEKYWNERIRILKKDYDEEDYQKQLKNENEELLKLKKELSEQILDDSLLSRNKQRDLRLKIEEQENKILEMQRKKGLDNQIEHIEDIIKKEQESTNEKIKELEKQLDAERIYTEARQALETGYLRWLVRESDGTWKKINGIVQTEMMKMEQAYISFENVYGEGLSVLGDKIKNEFISQIKIAQEEIKNLIQLLEQADMSNRPISEGVNIGDSNKLLSQDNLNYLTARFIDEYALKDPVVTARVGSVAGFEYVRDSYFDSIMNPSGTIDPNKNRYLRQIFDDLTKDQQKQMLDYIASELLNGRIQREDNQGVVRRILEDLAIVSKLDTIPMFDSGGFTGNWSGNKAKLAGLHPEELILDKDRSSKFASLMSKLDIAHTNILPNISSKLPKFYNSILSSPTEFKFDNLITINGNVDNNVIGQLKDASSNIINQLNMEFNKRGYYRKR